MRSFHSRLGLVVGLVLAVAPSAFAQTYTWTAGSGNLWSNSGNWTPGGVPNAASVTARFPGVTGASVAVNGLLRSAD